MWKLTILLILNICGLVSVCTGESVTKYQSCSDLDIPQFVNFDLNEFAGTWYELSRYTRATQNGQCNHVEYGTPGRNGEMSVVNRQVVNERWTSISGTATADNTGQITVTLTVDGLESWKMSRTQSLESRYEIEMNEFLRNNLLLDQIKYEPTTQSCLHYPEFNPLMVNTNQPLPTCNISGVKDFNLTAYSGTWFEIKRYPNSEQNGQCNRAVYELLPRGDVSVLYSEVVDERLVTISGRAVANKYGPGSLQVDLNVNNGIQRSNYHVLAVDYDDYALLCSCIDTQNGYMQVRSWMLSRKETPSEAANIAIGEVISITNELDQGSYIVTSQDPVDCFYYPDFDQPPYIELPGNCDHNIRGVANFNAVAYSGPWLEVARYPNSEQNGQCNRAVYGPLPGGAISVLHSEVVDEEWQAISGEAVAHRDGTGELQVTLNVNNDTVLNDYYVLATDYNEYALVYSCTDNSDIRNKRVGSWKLSRTETLSPTAETVMDEIIKKTHGLHQKYYQTTSQSPDDCFYYPDFDQPPDYIELPGPCSTAIKGVSNFKMAAFAGPWLEVARYPLPTQTGQCNRAEYAVMTTRAGMSVINSQIVDKRLFTIAGQAILTNVNKVGQLRVTLNGSNNENWQFNSYILATDYFNYALVYSCTNVDNGNRRRVGSWKLSRTGILTPQDNAAINEVITKTQGLTNKYYQITDQSDEACFYYPDITPNDSIIIPGQCDETISGFAPFDINQFQGTWYQIKRYDPVTPSCVGTRLTQDSDNINLMSYEVVDGQFSIKHRRGRINSTDNIGQFSLFMPVGGSEETTEIIIYILTTDYTSYALAYSCKNEDNFRRRIRAWQLSRGRTMSPAGETAIADLIEQRQELHQSYFRTVEQNDLYCPEPSAAFLMKSTTIVIFVCIVVNFII
uniref:SFRICE_011468 n=1 Tax=Spodoptera frugiperda TaxID=7108 RepID=A0A2H1WEV9_SPOFR